MKRLTVERVETKYIICKGDDERLYAILPEEAPAGLKKGDRLTIDNEGVIAAEKPAK